MLGQPKSGSRLYGYSFDQIKHAFKKGTSLPYLGIQPIKKIQNDKMQYKADPKYDNLKGLTKEQIKQLLEKAKMYDIEKDKDKSESEKGVAALKYKIQNYEKEIVVKESLIAQQDKLLKRKDSQMSKYIIQQKVVNIAKALGIAEDKYILNDNTVWESFKCDPTTGEITVIDESGSDTGFTIEERIKKYKEDTPHFWKDFYNKDNLGITGMGKNKQGDWRKLNPKERIEYARKQEVRSK